MSKAAPPISPVAKSRVKSHRMVLAVRGIFGGAEKGKPTIFRDPVAVPAELSGWQFALSIASARLGSLKAVVEVTMLSPASATSSHRRPRPSLQRELTAPSPVDRKRLVEGKRGSVRGNLGGR